ncbi:MAG: hypothetical protein GY744_19860 [Gammaproteobacteria bacterium]|nr:hypothetical protein [Gammaproteobacteria bacterium]
MGVFEMVVAVVAISITGGVISKSIKAKIEAEKSANKSDRKISEKRFNEIEQRLIVLEQIVTSEGYELNQQFKNIENEKIK